MGNRLAGLGSALYDSKRKEFLGRDGARWGKLGVFYFFFYLGLAGFFCAMLAVFMALTPKDHPYYTSHDSRMETRSNPLSPGLGFRPQPDVDKNLISVVKSGTNNDTERAIKSLDQYLQIYYWKNDGKQRGSGREFSMRDAGECTLNRRFGYTTGRPCVLVKLNKIVDFVPEPLRSGSDAGDLPNGCQARGDSVKIVCQGEYPADIDNIGQVRYYSESGFDNNCGSLNQQWFPYKGKEDRVDVYQAPYIWAQFINPKPNILINVICRAYAQNIDFDKKTGRGLTRFQIYVDGTNANDRSSRRAGEI